LSGTTRASRYQKGKPIWILLKQETVSGSGISWAICKSAPCCRQITTPAPHHSVFYRPDALPAAQPTASKHWRHSTEGIKHWNKQIKNILNNTTYVNHKWEKGEKCEKQLHHVMTLLVTHNCINIRKKTGETDKHKTAALHFLLWTADSIIKKTISLAIQRSLHSLTQSQETRRLGHISQSNSQWIFPTCPNSPINPKTFSKISQPQFCVILCKVLLVLHPFNSLFSRTTCASQYQKVTTSPDLTPNQQCQSTEGT